MSVIPWKADVWKAGTTRTADDRRAIVLLKGKMSASEVAEKFHTTRSAVCAIWFRARRHGGGRCR